MQKEISKELKIYSDSRVFHGRQREKKRKQSGRSLQLIINNL